MATTVRLTRIENAAYQCKATYEYKGHRIEGDDICFSGDHCYWYCKDIFGTRGFWTLRGLRKALAYLEEHPNDVEFAYRFYSLD